MHISKAGTGEIMYHAWKKGIVIPGFNIPYLPMIEPVVRALSDTAAFGLIMVARLEWIKFKAVSLKHVCEEYRKNMDVHYTRLHLDHVPVVDEDGQRVDFERIINEALEVGYDSVMIDGSRLSLAENIRQTHKIVKLAHAVNVPVESELGAVMGHEDGPMPPYEELFADGRGFTSPQDAFRFVKETGTDWLSVAIGNIHGAITAVSRTNAKTEARLDISHLAKIHRNVNIPLVLHGGTGIRKYYIRESVKHGISKINIGTAIRQPYEELMNVSVKSAQNAVYNVMKNIIANDLEIAGSATVILQP